VRASGRRESPPTGFRLFRMRSAPALEEAPHAPRAPLRFMAVMRPVRLGTRRTDISSICGFVSQAALTYSEKVSWLERVDRETRRIVRARACHGERNAVHEVVLIATSEGDLAADVRPLVASIFSVCVESTSDAIRAMVASGYPVGSRRPADGRWRLARSRPPVVVNLESVPPPCVAMTVRDGPRFPCILCTTIVPLVGGDLTDRHCLHLPTHR